MIRLTSAPTLFAVGLAGGVTVTWQAHRAPSSPGWDAPVGDSGLRRSDLPLGGGAALLTAATLRRRGHRRAALAAAALGFGAAVGALGTGFADPLAPS